MRRAKGIIHHDTRTVTMGHLGYRGYVDNIEERIRYGFDVNQRRRFAFYGRDQIGYRRVPPGRIGELDINATLLPQYIDRVDFRSVVRIRREQKWPAVLGVIEDGKSDVDRGHSARCQKAPFGHFNFGKRPFASSHRRIFPSGVGIQPLAERCLEGDFSVFNARQWFADIREGTAGSIAELAQRCSVDRTDVGRMIPFAFLAPDIVEAILDGCQPVELTAARLRRVRDLPVSWVEQRRLLEFTR